MSDNTPFSYMCFGCMELANNARLKAYVGWAASQGAWAGSECCVEMPDDCFCPFDGLPSQYVDPVSDNACWVDPLIPESSEYLGMFVTKVTGLGDSTFSRGTTPNLGRGVTLNRPQSGSRVFAIEAILVGTSCCGMDYGLEFVRRVLELGGCGSGSCLTGCGDLGSCGLTCMTGRVCCPATDQPDDTGLRQWVNAGLVDGLTQVTEESNSCRCCWRKVTFTIQTETPEAYSIESVVCLDKYADLENTATRCFDWSDCEDVTVTDADCTDDPLCLPNACVLPSPPQRVNYCWCEPNGVSVDCCCATDLANHRDETYRIIIDAGKNPADLNFLTGGLRNLRIKFYSVDPRLPCPSDDAEAAGMWGTDQECAVLEVPYMKAGAQLIIDGRTDKITVECDTKCYPGAGSVFGIGGSDPFPLLASCAGIFICVEWDLGHTQFVNNVGLGAVPSHVRIERFKVYA